VMQDVGFWHTMGWMGQRAIKAFVRETCSLKEEVIALRGKKSWWCFGRHHEAASNLKSRTPGSVPQIPSFARAPVRSDETGARKIDL